MTRGEVTWHLLQRFAEVGGFAVRRPAGSVETGERPRLPRLLQGMESPLSLKSLQIGLARPNVVAGGMHARGLRCKDANAIVSHREWHHTRFIPKIKSALQRALAVWQERRVRLLLDVSRQSNVALADNFHPETPICVERTVLRVATTRAPP